MAWRWYESDAAKRKIENALASETKALRKAAQTQEQLEQIQYIHDINLAWRSWDAGDVINARRLVKGCDPKRRQWEWHYLRRLVFPELLTLAERDDISLGIAPPYRSDRSPCGWAELHPR